MKTLPIQSFPFSELVYVLRAVDELNRWARAGGPRHAIYYLKREAIRETERRGLNAYRLIRVVVKCSRCSKGIYFNWEGENCGRCRHCNGTGKAALDFVETLIIGELRWHSPRSRFYMASLAKLDFEAGPWLMPQDWLPNQPGLELDPVRAAHLLNIAEPAFGAALDVSWDSSEFCGKCDHFAYSLPLGKFRDCCQLCGSAEDLMGHGCHRDRFEWTSAACANCQAKFSGAEIFDALPLPEFAAAEPEIVAWKKRHDAWFAEQEEQKRRRLAQQLREHCCR